jgi:hypothetical protein
MMGANESSSLHRMFNASSDIALQVRAKRDRERLPPGESRMASRSFLVASGSRKMIGNIFCWYTEYERYDDDDRLLLPLLLRVRNRAERMSNDGGLEDIRETVAFKGRGCAHNTPLVRFERRWLEDGCYDASISIRWEWPELAARTQATMLVPQGIIVQWLQCRNPFTAKSMPGLHAFSDWISA